MWTGEVTPPQRVTLTTWGPPPPCKQALIKGAMSPNTHARASENKLEKDGPTFSSCVGDFGRLFLSV